jgi:hypothetical protein
VPKYRVAPLFVALLASCAGHLPPTTGEPDFGGQWLLTLKAANSELQIASGHLELRRTAQREHFLGPAEPCERCWEGPFQVSLSPMFAHLAPLARSGVSEGPWRFGLPGARR